MATLECQSLGFVPNNYIDAKTLGIRTLLDGEYFQYFTVAVSGPELLARWEPETKQTPDRFWPAVALTTVEDIRAIVVEHQRSGTKLADSPDTAIQLRADLARVDEVVRSPRSLPSIEEGHELGPIDL